MAHKALACQIPLLVGCVPGRESRRSLRGEELVRPNRFPPIPRQGLPSRAIMISVRALRNFKCGNGAPRVEFGGCLTSLQSVEVAL
jgi:hypothetical protein